MTQHHPRIAFLAASALDFDLTPSEGAELSEGLAACATCRGRADGYARVARQLAGIDVVHDPAPLRARVEHVLVADAMGHRRPFGSPLMALALLAALVALVAASLLAAGSWRTHRTPGPGQAGLIAYSMGGKAWVSRPDGSGIRQLGTTATVVRSPTFSPDGTRIAFWADSSDRTSTQVEVYDLGQDTTTTVSSPSLRPDLVASESQLRWSADGRQVAYAADDATGLPYIEIASASGAPPHRLTTDMPADEPALSPDGRLLAFRGWLATGHVVPYVMDLSTGERVRVPALGDDPGYWNYVSPEWSPDGTRVVTSGSNGSWADHDIFEYLVAERRWLDVVPGDTDDFWPTWSPDGSRILFVSGHENAPSQLQIVNRSGSDRTDLQRVLVAPYAPHWSPDGSRVLALACHDLSCGSIDLVVVDPADKLDPVVIGPAPREEPPSLPSWESANQP